MDLIVLKKKINSYRTPKGRITNVPDDLLGEILHAWEQWTGPSSSFYKQLDVDYRKMGSLMGRAKRLKRDGAFDELNFTEVKVIDHDLQNVNMDLNRGIEILWANKHSVRFAKVDDLIYFLEYFDNKNIQGPDTCDSELEEVA